MERYFDSGYEFITSFDNSEEEASGTKQIKTKYHDNDFCKEQFIE